MTFRTAAAVASLALLAGACATTTTTTSVAISGTPVVRPIPVPPFDPAGKWSLSVVAQGQPMDVVMELVKLPDGGYSGTLTSEFFPPITITKATLTGKQMSMTYPIPSGETGSMSLLFNGDLVEGEWAMPGDGSRVSGKKM